MEEERKFIHQAVICIVALTGISALSLGGWHLLLSTVDDGISSSQKTNDHDLIRFNVALL